jgi:hypothetical protein
MTQLIDLFMKSGCKIMEKPCAIHKHFPDKYLRKTLDYKRLAVAEINSMKRKNSLIHESAPGGWYPAIEE